MLQNQNSRVVIVVPIYKTKLSEVEERVLRHSLSVLKNHDACFIAPSRLDLEWYRQSWPHCNFLACPDEYFTSPQAYTKLMLGPGFYQYFATYSHMLVLQTDAVVLRDELSQWTSSPFDYVGAPWPTPYSITLPDVGNGFSNRTFVISVGNGGFSIRRISACIDALQDCGWILKKTPMDEDLFFAMAGQISRRFLVPNTVTAATFSLELNPRTFFAMTGVPPMGGHAWEKWDKGFWLDQFTKVGLTGLQNTPVFSEDSLIKKALKSQESGDIPKATELFQQALTINPSNWVALYSLCVIEARDGHGEQALAHIETAISASPDTALLHYGRAQVLQGMKRLTEALASYDKAIELQPDYQGALNNRGTILSELHRLDEAVKNYDQLLSLHPNNEQGLCNRGLILCEQGLSDQAIPSFTRLIKKNPSYEYADGFLAHARALSGDWTDFKKQRTRIVEGVRKGKQVCNSLAFMSLSDSAEEHFLCTRILANDVYPPAPKKLWNGEAYAHAKIRIAYVSPDFREHPVAHLIAGVLEQHDKTRFETFGISLGDDDESALRKRIVSSFDHFIDVREMSAQNIATLMRNLEIDIAVDLAGYTKNSRTEIFAWRPAPVQINYLGFPGTMASDYFDYIIADRHVIPEKDFPYYSEKVIHLPGTYLPCDDTLTIAKESITRHAAGLPADAFVFCSFNHEYKINPDVFDVWVRLLKKIEGSVLWLMKLDETAATNLIKEAKKRGIDSSRLVFAERLPRIEDHLARYRLANLYLDTTPYNAHSTANDVLRTGLPLLTCSGRGFPSRVAASILYNLGFPELVTNSLADYEKSALAYAQNPLKLKSLRDQLQALDKPDIFDTKLFCRNLESAYIECAQRH
jgi:predicted O-linked N-acetylglucosamine transferase (SPINDLY family)